MTKKNPFLTLEFLHYSSLLKLLLAYHFLFYVVNYELNVSFVFTSMSQAMILHCSTTNTHERSRTFTKRSFES